MKKLKFFFLYFICLQASAQSTLIATQVKSYQVDRLDNVLYIDLKSNITKIEIVFLHCFGKLIKKHIKSC